MYKEEEANFEAGKKRLGIARRPLAALESGEDGGDSEEDDGPAMQ